MNAMSKYAEQIKNVKVAIEKITPDIAAEMLKLNTKNRPISRGHVRFLAKEIREGRFHLNGDTIVFADDSSVMNGQHRLWAIVESGVTVHILVVRGIPRELFATYDGHKKRSGGDILPTTNSKHVSSSLTFVDTVLNRRSKNYRHSLMEIQQLFVDHPGMADCVSRWYQISNLMNIRVGVGLYYIFSRIDETQADAFFQALISGENLDRSSPIYLLRERLISNRLSRAKLQAFYIAALMIKAWNAVRDGKPIGTLKHTDETLPQISGVSPATV